MHTNAQTQIPKINFCEREIKETNWDTSEMKQTKEKKKCHRAKGTYGQCARNI